MKFRALVHLRKIFSFRHGRFL